MLNRLQFQILDQLAFDTVIAIAGKSPDQSEFTSRLF